ncbi:hypothetical protein KDN34_06750 [Shewanella yunxiaonensis]|uniref:Integral membrane protein n=1 Tax=Shewanella yunxiaonensis TaxID=2829809 RepID=A0ABX7YWQ2_9GAMM|nr:MULTISPECIES: hypothetical protein [Shewanella]MDF0534342.1 hypothetical protein [Shewanella sp. A32]QUN07124.1 hypothetical protein KDN34_06750 [Shewanella yunxiaonensis]
MNSSSFLLRIRIVFATILLTSSLPAFADQTNGVLASVFVILGLGGFTLVNLALQLLFYFNGQYNSRRFVITHTSLSLLMPLIAAAMVLADNSSTAYLTLNLGLIIIAAALALLPLQLKNSPRRSGPHAGWIMLAAAAVLSLLSLLAWPLSVIAAILAWFTVNRQPQENRLFKSCRWLLILLPAGWCVYKLYYIWQLLLGS